jgi:hypothetical protein
MVVVSKFFWLQMAAAVRNVKITHLVGCLTYRPVIHFRNVGAAVIFKQE